MVSYVKCPVPEGKPFRKVECVNQMCVPCKFNLVRVQTGVKRPGKQRKDPDNKFYKPKKWISCKKEEGIQKFKWRRYTTREKVGKKGKVFNVTEVVPTETTSKEFLEFFWNTAKYFCRHQWTNHFMKPAIQDLQDAPLPGHITEVADFSERYSSVPLTETGGEYRYSKSCSLLPLVVRYHTGEGKMTTEAHAYYGDDFDQTPDVVQYCTEDLLQDVRKRGAKRKDPPIKYLDLVTDGCAGQFKGANALWGYKRLATEYDITVSQACPATAHGKDWIDICGGVEKSEVKREELKVDTTLDVSGRMIVIVPI